MLQVRYVCRLCECILQDLDTETISIFSIGQLEVNKNIASTRRGEGKGERGKENDDGVER